MVFYLLIVLAAAATTVYHVAQKSIPTGANPLAALAIMYATALALSLGALPLSLAPGQTLVRAVRGLNWAVYAVGASIFCVELAFLLAYRAGWRISLASVVSNVATALLLVAIGLLFYHESLSAKHVAGVLLCLVGLLLVAQP